MSQERGWAGNDGDEEDYMEVVVNYLFFPFVFNYPGTCLRYILTF